MVTANAPSAASKIPDCTSTFHRSGTPARSTTGIDQYRTIAIATEGIANSGTERNSVKGEIKRNPPVKLLFYLPCPHESRSHPVEHRGYAV
jgi:hypothetical protein